MNDLVALQYALYRGLRSCSLFNDATIALAREYIAQKIDVSKCWISASTTGKYGVGIVVQVPETRFVKPNSLQRERHFGIAIYENPHDNWRTGVGTFRGSDDWADAVIDFLWNWRLWRSSGLILEDQVAKVDDTFASRGILGHVVSCYLRQERAQPARPATPVLAADGSRVVTISGAGSAAVYYTTDGFSYPGADNTGSLPSEHAATLYTIPFTVPAATTVQAAAFTTGLLPSQVATLNVA